jgi:heat shock 70kDa protein 4
MDRILIDRYSEEFVNKYGVDPRTNPKALIRMQDAVEKARKVLSGIAETSLNIECLVEDNDLAVNITRDDFEAMIMPLLERFNVVCQKVLKDSSN